MKNILSENNRDTIPEIMSSTTHLPNTDLPNQSPISFDKAAIIPIEELEVEYEWVGYYQNLVSTSFDNQKSYLENHDKAVSSLPNNITSSLTMKSNSNIFLGIVFSLVGAIGAAYIWGSTIIKVDELIENYVQGSHHYAFMAILVGFLTGLGMRWGGRGRKPLFGVIACLITIIGFFVGNVLAAVEPIVTSFQLSYYETFTTFDASHLWGFLKDRFEYIDIVFYTLGLAFAYLLGFRKPKTLFK